MKKVVHDSKARIRVLDQFIREHIADILELCCRPGSKVEFSISDVKRDGSVRVKIRAVDDLYHAVVLCTGLHFRGVKSASYDDVYAYVPLADVPLDLKW